MSGIARHACFVCSADAELDKPSEGVLAGFVKGIVSALRGRGPDFCVDCKATIDDLLDEHGIAFVVSDKPITTAGGGDA